MASAARGNTHMAPLNRSLDHFTCPRTALGNVSLWLKTQGEPCQQFHGTCIFRGSPWERARANKAEVKRRNKCGVISRQTEAPIRQMERESWGLPAAPQPCLVWCFEIVNARCAYQGACPAVWSARPPPRRSPRCRPSRPRSFPCRTWSGRRSRRPRSEGETSLSLRSVNVSHELNKPRELMLHSLFLTEMPCLFRSEDLHQTSNILCNSLQLCTHINV